MMSSDVGGATLAATGRRGVARSSTSLRDSGMPWASATFGGSRTCATGMGEVSGIDHAMIIIIKLYCHIQRALHDELECSLVLTPIVPICTIK